MPRLRELAHLLYLVAFRPALAVAVTLAIVLVTGLVAAQPAAGIFAVAFSLLVLGYASYRDIKQRTVPNKVWLLMLLVGASFLLYYILNNSVSYIIRAAWSLGVTSILCYLFFRFRLIGGADAKSLICIAVLFPAHPQFAIFSRQFPVYGGVPEAFPLAMLTILYGSLLALVVPIFLFFHNLQKLGIRAVTSNLRKAFVGYRLPVDRLAGRRNVKLLAMLTLLYGALLAFLVTIFLFFRNLPKLGVRAVLSNLGLAFLGYRVPLDQLAGLRNIKLLHVYEESNGSVHRRFKPGGMPVDEATLERLRRYHKQEQIPEVWVTLDLPFLVFVTGGFVMSTFLGGLFLG